MLHPEDTPKTQEQIQKENEEHEEMIEALITLCLKQRQPEDTA